MSIEILRPGALTTVVDLGRPGHAAEGYPECGACDKLAYAVATIMAGNAEPVAALECTFLGPLLRFDADVVVTVSGARPLLNGRAVRAGFPLRVRQGDELDVGQTDGLRAYVAVYGGIDVPVVLGSRSTDLRCGLGGFEGRALRAGDALPVPTCDADAVFARLLPRARRVRVPALSIENGRETSVRVIPGPQADAFTAAGTAAFYAGAYTASTRSDRMGLRLEGPAIEAVRGADILSDAIVEGSVQVSADGQPIVMLADHQSLGGYAKIATVIPTDIPLLAQLRPGQAIRFREIDRRDATALYRNTAAQLTALLEEMGNDDELRGHQLRPGRELWRLHAGHGRAGAAERHFRQRRLRLSRR